MSYEMKTSLNFYGNRATLLAQKSCRRSSSSSSISSSLFQANHPYSPIYSQCGDLFSNIKFLSRSLRRMNVDHAITGKSAMVMESGTFEMEVEPEIELILSNDSYEHFLKICVHQQVKPIDGEDRMFWDNRTGCTIRVYVVGENFPQGRRSMEIPALHLLPTNDEGIKSWNVEGQAPVSYQSKRLSVSGKESLNPIAA